MRSVLASSIVLAALVGCRSEVPPTDASNVTAPPATSVTSAVAAGDDAGSAPAPVADTTPPAAFTSCGADADCVAVPRVGCCKLGWNEAVNKSSVDAYAKSYTCPTSNPICPMIRVRDDRVAVCDHGACKMAKK